MRRATLVERAARSGRALPSSAPGLLYQVDILADFLELYWLAQSCLENRDDWARLAYESVIDGAAHGVVYRETFFTPARHLRLARGSRTSCWGSRVVSNEARMRPVLG